MLHHGRSRRWGRHVRRQCLPQPRFRRGKPDRPRQRPVIAHREVQSAHAIHDPLGGTADIRANDRFAEHPSLGHDEAEDLPPCARDNAPIHPRHPIRKFVEVVRSIPAHDLLVGRKLGFLGEEFLDLRTDRRRCVPDVVAVQVDAEIGEALGPQMLDGAEQDVHALVVDELAEEAEPVLRVRRGRRGRAVAALPIRDVMDALAWNAPAHVMLDHEPARAGEHVDDREMRLEP